MHDLVSRSKIFSEEKHKGQVYGAANLPYDFHLQAVHDVLVEFGYTDKTLEGRTLLAGSFLHDVMEDCGVTYEELAVTFGRYVATTVFAVTDEGLKGEPRSIRKDRTYLKLANNKMGTVLKLADRIANVRRSKEDDSSFMQMYRKEQPEFKRRLYKPGMADEMWQCLEELFK